MGTIGFLLMGNKGFYSWGLMLTKGDLKDQRGLLMGTTGSLLMGTKEVIPMGTLGF